MTEPSRIVFLSYAAQDAAAALRIADALRTVGIEVWLDKSELRGGEAWDRQIRDRIRECRLFIPVISANTEARDEGYFRREWKLAVERTQDMSERKAFLLPVVIDDTAQEGASVPDRFRDVHWTQVPGGETPAEFIAHVAHLLSPDPGRNVRPSVRAPSGGASNRDLNVRRNADATAVEVIGAQGQRDPSPRTQEHQPPRSIAVLPFANLSPDHEQEYFSDGLTEELINHLAHVRGLRVLGRTSSFAFKGKNEDLRVIGQKLAVGCIVEGSVRKAGNRLRITAQLVDCADGYHLWSETFDRELDDVFQIQSEISRSVAEALGTALRAIDSRSGGTRNIEAYERYLRARSLSRLFVGPVELQRAIELYHEALRLDPEFVLAWTGLASAYAFITVYAPTLALQSAKEWVRAVERAVAIAPDLWASQAAQGGQQVYERNWEAAHQAMQRAVELSPESELAATFSFAVLLQDVGRVREGNLLFQTALKTDPLSMALSTQLQWGLTIIGDDAGADAEYSRSLDLAGDRSGPGHAALERARRFGLLSKQFKAQAELFLTHDSVHSPFESELLHLTDDPEAARKLLRGALDDPACSDNLRQLRVSWWAAVFSDIDLSLIALRRAVIDMRSVLLYAIWLPAYGSVRTDPRFKVLLRDLKLVDYWRASGNWGEFARPLGPDDFEVW